MTRNSLTINSWVCTISSSGVGGDLSLPLILSPSLPFIFLHVLEELQHRTPVMSPQIFNLTVYKHKKVQTLAFFFFPPATTINSKAVLILSWSRCRQTSVTNPAHSPPLLRLRTLLTPRFLCVNHHPPFELIILPWTHTHTNTQVHSYNPHRHQYININVHYEPSFLQLPVMSLIVPTKRCKTLSQARACKQGQEACKKGRGGSGLTSCLLV